MKGINTDSKWMKAAVAGGLWASFEIIVGSMLHNLHLPFSGTILASFSVILMTAFMQIWNTQGIIWRAGLICGLMKSLSPSAVILGPMTGIMMEALVMDLIIYLFGRNLFAYLLAGIGALLSAIIHKLANLFILYGTDIVQIYSNLFYFLKNQLGFNRLSGEALVAFVLTMYVLMGLAAAFTGYYLGRYASRQKMVQEFNQPRIDPFRNEWTRTDPNQPFRIFLLFLHLAMVPVILVLINRFRLSPAALLPAGGYMLFLLLYYKRIYRRLMKPFFWVQLLLMTLIAGFFWNPSGERMVAHENGFLIGLEMSMRAIVIVSAFSALSVEIRNPRITNYILGLGWGNFYAAVSLSFNSLPVMLDRSADMRTFLRNPARALSSLIFEAEIWLKCYQTHLKE